MRVAYLINQYPKVSHSFIRREILALERQGFDIIRIALRGSDGEIVSQEDLLERKRTRYVLRHGLAALPFAVLRAMLTRPISLLRALVLACRMGYRAERPIPVHLIYLAEACRIEAWLREAKAEHLHTHFGTNSAEVAMLVHALGGPSWSFTVHGPEEFDKPAFIGLPEKIRRCSFVVAISSYTRSQLCRWVEGRYWDKVHLVRCGLEPAYFVAPAPIAPPRRRLVCVGRLTAQKGQLLLIEAAHRLMAQGAVFELVLAGDGELRGAIEARVAALGMQGRVQITGWIGGEEVRDEILAARALVLPSFAEGLPVVLMEAMALRRPVISTYVAGIPELVQSGEHGWLVPAGDPDALASAMQNCLDAPTHVLARMGQAAHERASALHDIDAQAAVLVKLMRKVREERRS
jgi:colanic acid/amylovoran biosynthesis glycosyltransferase